LLITQMKVDRKTMYKQAAENPLNETDAKYEMIMKLFQQKNRIIHTRDLLNAHAYYMTFNS